MRERVIADPTKEFFVDMITRDISLEDSILDLIDNSADGARRQVLMNQTGDGAAEVEYSGFQVNVWFDSKKFIIEDNCGGMSIELATKYAFRFGRRPGTMHGVAHGIGLYGIGMKRAVFKLGKHIWVESSTETDAFVVEINVDIWLNERDDHDRPIWDFELEKTTLWNEPGTRLKVLDLRPGIAAELGDPTFKNELIRVAGRAYFKLLLNGFEIKINGTSVEPYAPDFLFSDDIEPAFVEYTDEYLDGIVSISLQAGLTESPPDDLSAEAAQKRAIRAEKSGWYIICNDRTVLAADKTDRTVWGDSSFARWHFQYNGFLGIASFSSDNPDLLPWTTTKRDVDEEHPVYQRTVQRMKDLTQPILNYTSRRKADLETAKELERLAIKKKAEELRKRPQAKLPTIAVPRIEYVSIQYSKPVALVKKVAEALGMRKAIATKVGEKTFDYFVKDEGLD